MSKKLSRISIVLAATVALLVLVTVLPACQAKPAGPITWKLGGHVSLAHFNMQAATKLADAVAQRTNGQLKIEVFPAGQLFKSLELHGAVLSGAADVVAIGNTYLMETSPLQAVTTLPFSIPTWDKAKRAHVPGTALRKEMEKAAEKQNTKIIMYTPYGPQGLLLMKDVERLADLKGLKVKSSGAMDAAVEEAAGMIPREISSADRYAAMQRGTLDGSMHSAAAAVNNHYEEIGGKVYLAIGYIFATCNFYVNGDRWNELPGSMKKIVLEEAAKVESETWVIGEVAEQEAFQKLEAAGIKVRQLTEAEITEWKSRVSHLYDEFEKEHGGEAKKLVELMEKA